MIRRTHLASPIRTKGLNNKQNTEFPFKRHSQNSERFRNYHDQFY